MAVPALTHHNGPTSTCSSFSLTELIADLRPAHDEQVHTVRDALTRRSASTWSIRSLVADLERDFETQVPAFKAEREIRQQSSDEFSLDDLLDDLKWVPDLRADGNEAAGYGHVDRGFEPRIDGQGS